MDALDKLQEIIKTLRGPNGCPWDQKQTLQTLTPHIIEEAYEVVNAIQEKTTTELKEETGDLLLQAVLISHLASEKSEFTLNGVIETLNEKLIRRHPHVFGNKSATTEEEAWKHWEAAKDKEKDTSILATIPKTLPALMEAQKVQKKAAQTGFDWDTINAPIEKLYSEINELKEAIDSNNNDNIHEEFGDVLFSLVNVGRKLKINTEEALKKSTNKFKKRFTKIETLTKENNESISDLSLEQLTHYWDSIKEKNTYKK